MIDAYKIGIRIALSNGVSGVLKTIQKDVLGLHHSVNMTTGGFNRMKLAAAGMAAVTIGGAMLTGLYDLSKAGEAYTHQLVQMRLAGMSVLEQQEAIRSANRVASSVLTTAPTENLQAIRELRGALNSAGASPAAATKEAVEHLEAVQKAQAVMTSALGKNRGSDVFEMVKALEDINATKDPARFDKLLDGMVRSSITFGGRLSGTDFFQNLKYTRGAGAGYSDEFIQFYMPTLMQELKAGKGSGAGGGAGNPLASLFQTVVGGQISNKAAQEWLKLGLIDPAKIIRTKTGNIKGVGTGGFRGSDEAVRNPFFYMRDYVMKALESHGITKPEAIREELAHLFPNRVAQQMASLLMQVSKMEGDRKLTEAAEHMDPAFRTAVRNDPVLARAALAAQKTRVEDDLGKAISPTVTHAIYDMAKALSYVAQVIERHPTATKWIVGMVAALAGLLVVFGTLAIGVAAFGALGVGLSAAPFVLASAGIAALFGAAAYLATMVDWRAAGAAFMAGATWLGSTVRRWAFALWNAPANLAAAAGNWTTQIVASLKTDLQNVWIGLTEGLVNLVKNLGAWLHGLPGRIVASVTGGSAPAAPGGGIMPGSPKGGSVADQGLVLPGAYRGPAMSSHHVRVENIMYLDGEVVHRSVTTRQDRAARGSAQHGLTGFDSSETPFLSGGMLAV
ncbi:MAG: hypothetical protein ACRYHQ_14060 [Janthinobacterium lividum]